MKKAIVIIVIFILIIFGLSYLGKTNQNTTKTDTEAEKIASYFEDRVITLGVKDIGQPIEGFDAELVRLAFPGFITTDFEGVETFEGYYKVNGDRIEYIRSATQPITSAEKTISPSGYATLLKNTSNRLNIVLVSNESIDTLIEKVNIAERISLKVGKTVNALGITITALSVEEDSRCPVDVTCIQAGTVRLKTKLVSGLGEAEQVFSLMEPITTEAEIVTMIAVEPEANSKVQIKDADYIFHFEIQKLVN